MKADLKKLVDSALFEEAHQAELECYQRELDECRNRLEKMGSLFAHDGEYRWFLFRVVPVRDEQGKLVRWYVTNTNIEDLRRNTP